MTSRNEQPPADKQPTEILPARKTVENAPTVTPAQAPGTHGPVFSLEVLDDESGLLGRIGQYEVFEVLGQGGMGIVYKAKQSNLDRIVALKVILGGLHAPAEHLKRFRVEAEAVARLHHPNIVQIYEVGEHEGHSYFSLEYVDGGTLADKIRDKPIASREAAKLVSTLASAMQVVHGHGLIHRDLKPANVLMTSENHPKITDFGLVKQLDVQATRTQTGAIMGTPSYMAPEQARGQASAIGPATDIYALGAILYELLTGRPPFRAETPLDTVLQVANQEALPVRLLNPSVPRDLETICMKCLEKDPNRRYESAQQLANDLDRYLRGESISIRSINFLDRLMRTLERSDLNAEFHSWGNVMLSWAVIVLLTHLAITFWMGNLHSKTYVTVAYAAQFLGMFSVFCWFRGPIRIAAATTAEYRLWVLCGAYAGACFLLLPISQSLPQGSHESMFYASYPFCCVLTGFFFFVLGCFYWGRFYVFGMLFFVSSVVLPYSLEWASLTFGVVWTIALASIGWHLRSTRSRKAEVESGSRI
ncbi:MAG: serine/threonine protein kinase [Gemmataceae bacterium]